MNKKELFQFQFLLNRFNQILNEKNLLFFLEKLPSVLSLALKKFPKTMPFVMAFDILVQVSIPIYKKYNQKTQIQNEQNEHIAQELEKNLFKELEKNLKKIPDEQKRLALIQTFLCLMKEEENQQKKSLEWFKKNRRKNDFPR